MASSYCLFFVVLICGLSTTDSSIRIGLEEDQGNPGHYLYTVACKTTDVDSSAKDIQMIQILKEKPGGAQTMVAHIGKSTSGTLLSNVMANDYSGVGTIDENAKEHSFLVLTLTNPQEHNAGLYVCDIYYTDASGKDQHIISSGTLELAKIIVQKDPDVAEDIKEIKDQISQLKAAQKKITTTVSEDEDLKTLQEQLNDLASNLTAEGKKCESIIDEQARSQEALVLNIVKNYNNQLSSLKTKMSQQEVAMKLLLKRVRDSFSSSVDAEVAGLKKSIADVKDELQEGHSQLDAKIKDGFDKHEEMFENFTRDSATKEAVSDIDIRVSSLETIFGKLAEKIGMLMDEVNVLKFLLDGSVPNPAESTTGPPRGPATITKDIANMASKITSLEQLASNQTAQISSLMKEVTTQSDLPAFAASFVKMHPGVIGQTLLFDKVVFNKGQAYNKATGIFTAPRPGIYAFHLVLYTRMVDEWVDVDMLANQKVIVRLTSKKIGENQATVSVATPLQAGDEVKSVIIYTGSEVKLPPLFFSMFSGYFVQSL